MFFCTRLRVSHLNHWPNISVPGPLIFEYLVKEGLPDLLSAARLHTYSDASLVKKRVGARSFPRRVTRWESAMCDAISNSMRAHDHPPTILEIDQQSKPRLLVG